MLHYLTFTQACPPSAEIFVLKFSHIHLTKLQFKAVFGVSCYSKTNQLSFCLCESRKQLLRAALKGPACNLQNDTRCACGSRADRCHFQSACVRLYRLCARLLSAPSQLRRSSAQASSFAGCRSTTQQFSPDQTAPSRFVSVPATN